MTSLEKIQIRYFPPGLNLVYKQLGKLQSKEVDLYGFDPFQEVPDTFVEDIIDQQSELLTGKSNEVQSVLKKISNKYKLNEDKKFTLKKSIKAHKQPLTNCMFSKYGDKFITASYDRLCHIWNTESGKQLSTLSGHRNAVFCLDFSRFSERELVATGSLDWSVKVWTCSGSELLTFKDHKAEVTSVKFNSNGIHLITCSFDKTVKMWDIEKGKLVSSMAGHDAQVIKVDQNYNGDLILSCSFDYTSKIWDLRSKTCVKTLLGHQGQINCCKFQYTGEICATASNDKTCIIWDIGTGKQIQAVSDHTGEIYDLDFSKRGDMFTTCSSDRTAKLYSTNTSALLHSFEGHDGEVTRVLFNPQGKRVITAGMDGIARVWDTDTGKNVDLLEGHSQEIFSCDVDYFGQKVITCSKDNLCNIWKLE